MGGRRCNLSWLRWFARWPGCAAVSHTRRRPRGEPICYREGQGISEDADQGCGGSCGASRRPSPADARPTTLISAPWGCNDGSRARTITGVDQPSLDDALRTRENLRDQLIDARYERLSDARRRAQLYVDELLTLRGHYRQPGRQRTGDRDRHRQRPAPQQSRRRRSAAPPATATGYLTARRPVTPGGSRCAPGWVRDTAAAVQPCANRGEHLDQG